jgi:hypothetical protein
MNAKSAAALIGVVTILLVATFFIGVQEGVLVGPPASSTTTTTTTVSTGGSYVNASQGLELRLSVNVSSSSTGSSDGNVTVSMRVDEYNTLAAANNVSKAEEWGLQGLSLGSCGAGAYPFGVALYRGAYTASNVSQAQPLQIYPDVACPMLIRLVTGYLFQPASDLAVVLPSGPNATPTQMSANVTAKAVYTTGAALPSSSSQPLSPGTYTVAGGDEWGSVVLTQLTVKSTSTGTSSTTNALGTLGASFSIGPTQPVCMANSTTGPAPAQYSSIKAEVAPNGGGDVSAFSISWLSNGCSVSGTLQTSLAPGAYSLSLSSCTFMGCASALPRSFVVVAGQSTSVDVSIDTGIR